MSALIAGAALYANKLLLFMPHVTLYLFSLPLTFLSAFEKSFKEPQVSSRYMTDSL